MPHYEFYCERYKREVALTLSIGARERGEYKCPDGDLDVSMQREVSEGEAATVPGDTIADRTLQRDTLAFLTQRDLSEAGPEARCRIRNVAATEVPHR